MTIALRLSNGRHVVPVRLAAGETVVESSGVHSAAGYVVLEPGQAEFTIAGRPQPHRDETFRHYRRIAEVSELPETVADEAEMNALRARWENADAFYRKVVDATVTETTPARTVSLTDTRIIEVAADAAPASADGWSPGADALGIPAPLSALVPGQLAGAAELVAARLGGPGRRVTALPVYTDRSVSRVTVEFQAAYSDARTRLVKKDPLNTRRNAKRVPVTDTAWLALEFKVPSALAAESLEAAHNEIDRLVVAAEEQLAEPLEVCGHCNGRGLIPSGAVRERKL